MGTQALLPDSHMSVEEYLHTSFDGADREYLDGEVVERNMGNKSHGKVQARLIVFFSNLEAKTGLFVVPELRHRVTRTRYRIPDIAVFEGEPVDEVPSKPPLVAIEILSPEDRMSKIMPKLAEYQSWGVRLIWVINPETRKLFNYISNSLHEEQSLAIPLYNVTLTLSDLFS